MAINITLEGRRKEETRRIRAAGARLEDNKDFVPTLRPRICLFLLLSLEAITKSSIRRT